MIHRALGHTEFSSFLEELLRFHGQDIYADIGPTIARKKPYFKFILAFITIVSRSKAVNLILIGMILLGYRIFRYPSVGNRVFQYGVSKNNIISFERLNRCLALQGVGDISINEMPVPFRIRLKAVFSVQTIYRAAVSLTKHRHDRPLVHLQAVIGCASLLLYHCHRLPETVKVICVASDHSPICQALLFLARREGRKTCYIQHAPVTDNFPPLAYDLTILYDQASLEAYKRAARRYGITANSKVVFLPPFEEAFSRPHLKSSRYVIGICLSFFPNLDAISGLLKVLSKKLNVSNILLRPHPRCQLDFSNIIKIDKVSIQNKSESISKFFNTVDIVLVPNSGVAIESLHNGKPTFFTPGMDDLPNDYYGFVENRIIPIFQADSLEGQDRLLKFFDDSWEARFSVYDETVNSSQISASQQVGINFLKLLT